MEGSFVRRGGVDPGRGPTSGFCKTRPRVNGGNMWAAVPGVRCCSFLAEGADVSTCVVQSTFSAWAVGWMLCIHCTHHIRTLLTSCARVAPSCENHLSKARRPSPFHPPHHPPALFPCPAVSGPFAEPKLKIKLQSAARSCFHDRTPKRGPATCCTWALMLPSLLGADRDFDSSDVDAIGRPAGLY